MVMMVDARQSLMALQDANQKRCAMAAVRSEISALGLEEGRLLVAGILDGELERPAAQAMTIWRLLTAITRLGPSRVERYLRRANVITGDRRVRELTNRQRVAVAAQLRGEDPA